MWSQHVYVIVLQIYTKQAYFTMLNCNIDETFVSCNAWFCFFIFVEISEFNIRYIQKLFSQASKSARNIFHANIMQLKAFTGIKIYKWFLSKMKGGGVRLVITECTFKGGDKRLKWSSPLSWACLSFHITFHIFQTILYSLQTFLYSLFELSYLPGNNLLVCNMYVGMHNIFQNLNIICHWVYVIKDNN